MRGVATEFGFYKGLVGVLSRGCSGFGWEKSNICEC